MDGTNGSATLLTFRLAADKYALRVSAVQEVLEYTEPTHMPGTSEVLAGVINVRGRIIPVVALRHRLGLPAEDRSVETAIVVAELQSQEEDALIGLIVDAVEGVIEVDEDEIESAPRLGSTVAAELIEGIVKSGERFTMLLRAERLVTDQAAQSMPAADDSQACAPGASP